MSKDYQHIDAPPSWQRLKARRAESPMRNSVTAPTASPCRSMRFSQTRFGQLCDESSRHVPTRSAEARFIRTVQKIEAGDTTILQQLRTALGCEWKRLLG